MKREDGFLPALMRMDEFEQRSVLVENATQVDAIERILLLREAAAFKAFESLNVNRDLIRFFTKSDALFKFFEELAAEDVDFGHLAEADAYAEFGEHLEILETLLRNYKVLLEKRGLTDKAFLPKSYRLNMGFVKSYETIEIHLEGYLSRFELELLEKIAEHTQLLIHYTTSQFNKKMQARFEMYGIQLPDNSRLTFDFSSKKILSCEPESSKIKAEVFSVEERGEQIAVVFEQVERMVRSGISPEKIAVVLPDEEFKEHFMLFDRKSNLNFAMGYDYMRQRNYKILDALYRYWQKFDGKERKRLERYGLALETIERFSPSEMGSVERLFEMLESLGLADTESERIYEMQHYFMKVFASRKLSLKEWLFLWLKALSKVTIDDVRGGVVTVMGVLETRGVEFEGVVIVDFNEGIVPASSSKDQFLNSSVRAFANLPTRHDREALQKQYYKRLLETSKEAAILYSTAENRLPSKFLYELGLDVSVEKKAQMDLLYSEDSQLLAEEELPTIPFDAHSVTWSASRLKTYLECKRKYYYRYIEKIEAKKEDDLIEGLFLHQLLDHLHGQKSSYHSKEEMTDALVRLLDTLLVQNDPKTAYRKLLWKEKLKGYVERQVAHFKAEWKVVEREKEFTGEIGGVAFKGRIDRIDQNGTGTLVLDYKSGSTKEANRTRNLELLTDFQMSIYHTILSPKYGNLSLAFIRILENGEMEEVTALEEKNALLAEHIVALKQAKEIVPHKCEDLHRCKYCEFALMCERGEYL
jgi:RecB family exonuclease